MSTNADSLNIWIYILKKKYQMKKSSERGLCSESQCTTNNFFLLLWVWPVMIYLLTLKTFQLECSNMQCSGLVQWFQMWNPRKLNTRIQILYTVQVGSLHILQDMDNAKSFSALPCPGMSWTRQPYQNARTWHVFFKPKEPECRNYTNQATKCKTVFTSQKLVLVLLWILLWHEIMWDPSTLHW